MDYYRDVETVLKRHPLLRLTVAHFFFGSERPALMDELLENYPNVYLDLTPNQFMYPDFSKNEIAWRPFFEKHQDRIIYGTDIGSNTKDTEGKEAEALVRMVRGFLENDEYFEELGCPVPPMKMSVDILCKIYKENMMTFYRHMPPKPLNYSVMRQELDTVKERYHTFLDLRDLENLKLVESVF